VESCKPEYWNWRSRYYLLQSINSLNLFLLFIYQELLEKASTELKLRRKGKQPQVQVQQDLALNLENEKKQASNCSALMFF